MKNCLISTVLSDVCSLVTDGTHDTPKRVESGFPLIKAKEIVGGSIDFETCDQISETDHRKVIARSKPEKFDTLFAHIGASLGEAAMVRTSEEFSIKNVALFKPDPNKIDGRYLYYLVVSPQFQALAKSTKTGAAQPFLGLGQLREHQIEYHEDLPTRTDPVKEEFLAHDRDVQRLYKAVMPDPIIPTLAPLCQVIDQLTKAIRAQADPVDISMVMGEISDVLDGAIVAEPHVKPGEKAKTVDLSQVDFEVLEAKFATSKTKNTEAQKLRALIERKLDNLIRLNASRYDFLDRFQKMVEDYNSGALTIEQLFEQLLSLSQELTDEEHRHMRENLSEEELAIFDILTRPGPDLTTAESTAIKKVCRDMLAKLKTEQLVLDWRKRRTTRAGVRVEIEKMLDSGLPEKYTTELFEAKCGAVFQHMLEKYPDQGISVYSTAV